ncbi:hypothetical protein ACQPZ2_34825 [Nocardia pseudovaccinii]|uniref:TetR/AcrR family transcriptional regulator n=1 Tax=Nocardia pseudovaccinii TaxID=189540 RepID=UPI003D8E9729
MTARMQIAPEIAKAMLYASRVGSRVPVMVWEARIAVAAAVPIEPPTERSVWLTLFAAGAGGAAAISRFVGAANDDTVRAILRERINSAFGDLLADRLDGPDTALRAELLAAIIVGVSFLRDKIRHDRAVERRPRRPRCLRGPAGRTTACHRPSPRRLFTGHIAPPAAARRFR